MSFSIEMDRLTADLRQASSLRKMTIDEMRRATMSMLASCASARGEIARDYRRRAHDFLADLAKDMAGHRHATVKEIAGFASARRKASSQVRADLKREVRAIKRQSSELRGSTAELVSRLAATHRDMAAQQRVSLDTGHRHLRSMVEGLRSSARKHRGEVRADQLKAHKIWSAFAIEQAGAAGKTPRRAAGPPKPAAGRDESKHAQSRSVKVKPAAGADLTEIVGIGPVMQKRLAKVGIATMVELAAVDAETLRERLGDVGRMADVGSWISQARDWMQHH